MVLAATKDGSLFTIHCLTVHMKLFAWMLLGVCLLMAPAGMVGNGQTGNSPPPSPRAAPPAPLPSQVQPASPPPTTYTLTPERRAQAIAYSRSLYILYFLGTLISIGIYLLLWRARIAANLRAWVCNVSRRLSVQCLIFVPLFVAAAGLLKLPLNYYSGYFRAPVWPLDTRIAIVAQ